MHGRRTDKKGSIFAHFDPCSSALRKTRGILLKMKRRLPKQPPRRYRHRPTTIFSISQGQITISLLPAKIAPLLMSGVKRAFPSLPEFPTRRRPLRAFTRASRRVGRLGTRQSRHQTQIDCRIDWAPQNKNNEFPTRARNSSASGRAQEPIIACFSKYFAPNK